MLTNSSALNITPQKKQRIKESIGIGALAGGVHSMIRTVGMSSDTFQQQSITKGLSKGDVKKIVLESILLASGVALIKSLIPPMRQNSSSNGSQQN